MTAAASLSQTFSSCTFTPYADDELSSTPIVTSDDGTWSTTSYYLDSSGRSSFILPLQVGCQSKEHVDQLVSSGCVQPSPLGHDECDSSSPDTPLLKFEVQSHPSSDTIAVAVEGITVLSCTVTGNSLLFETEVVVRAATPPRRRSSAGVSRISSRLSSSSTRYAKTPSMISAASTTDGAALDDDNNMVSTLLEITAILSYPKESKEKQSVSPGLLALELGGGTLPGDVNHPSHGGTKQIRLSPALLNLELTHALALSVKNVTGSSCGKTLVSLTIKHSNTHSRPATVTNLALHPGHSRQEAGRRKDRSMPGGQHYVTDMSKFVQWGYAPQTEPNLPLTLYPHDAYSTVLVIDAGEDLRSRLFISPISVTAMVGEQEEEDSGSSSSRRPCVVVTTDSQWITGRVAVEPADAFRIDMSLKESSCFVGGQLLVSLRVVNLSTETKDLMLLMAKDDDKASLRSGSVNTAVVSEVNGYTFGVWGLSTGDDDGTARHNRDHELLAVDAALLLGEVKGQHSVDAELRFVPLREGTLDVPNFKLYDKMHGKWYNCVHMLKIVAAAKK